MRSSIAVVAAASAIAFTQIASAADLPRKAPLAPLPAPVYHWSGFYIGGNIGYGWGDAQSNIAGSGTTTVFPGDTLAITHTPFTSSGVDKPGLDGVIGGGQVGYNYQFNSRWLLGFEADFQGSAQRGSNTFVASSAGQLCFAAGLGPICLATSPLNGTAVTGYEAKIDWFGTVRGRLGWLVTDQTLLYVTGGLAYGHVGVSGNHNVSASSFIPGFGLVTFGPGAGVFGASKTKAGFAVGAGAEGKLAAGFAPNWTWKVEYLYVDLGSLDTSTPFSASSSFAGFTALAGTITTHTRFTDNIVRVGLNYQFGH